MLVKTLSWQGSHTTHSGKDKSSRDTALCWLQPSVSWPSWAALPPYRKWFIMPPQNIYLSEFLLWPHGALGEHLGTNHNTSFHEQAGNSPSPPSLYFLCENTAKKYICYVQSRTETPKDLTMWDSATITSELGEKKICCKLPSRCIFVKTAWSE